jgi:hypothetical protein
MKTRLLPLILILLALAMAETIRRSYRVQPDLAAESMSVEPPAPADTKADQEVPATAPVSGDVQPASAEGFSWRYIESEDHAQLIANLRRIRCPEQTIRDIVLARVDGAFAEREALYRFRPAEGSKPWGSRAPLTAAELEAAKKWRAVEEEKRALLRELLGIQISLDVLPSTYTRNYEDFQAAFQALPTSKRDLVQAMKEDYWQRSDALKEKYKEGSQQDYLEEYWQLNRDHVRALARVLSKQELEEFLMRTSVTGTSLASRLADFGPTEEEFRGIFRLQRRYEIATGRVGGQFGMVEVDEESRVAGHEGLLEHMKLFLGEERLAQYQRSPDSAYRNLVVIAGHFGLASEIAVKAYELEKEYREAGRLFQDRALADGTTAPEGRNTIGSQEAELRKAQAALLGDEPSRAYQRLRTGKAAAVSFDP